MAIPLTDVFKKDIDSKITNIENLVIFGWDIENSVPQDNAIFVADSKQYFDNNQYIDSNLKVSLIKEKLNLDTRALTLNKLNIKLSNLNNITDSLSSLSIINLPVAVFWKSQSCKTLSDCPIIYMGNVIRYKHDDKIATIQLEDNTGINLDKTVPIANIGAGSKAYSEKYVNKPIPIAYGFIPKAPAVIWPNTGSQSSDSYNESYTTTVGFYVIADDIFNSVGDIRQINGNLNYGQSNLLMDKGEGHFWKVYNDPVLDFDDRLGDGDSDNNDYLDELGNINEDFQQDNYKGLDSNIQVREFENKAFFCPREYDEYQVPKNPIARNFCLAWLDVRPANVFTSDTIVTENDDETINNGGSMWTEFLGPTKGLFISNPDAMKDVRESPETIALNFNTLESYSRFPDNDIDSLAEFEGFPQTNLANELTDFLNNSTYGNFLNYIPLEIGYAQQGRSDSPVYNENISPATWGVTWLWPYDEITNSDGDILSLEIPEMLPYSPSVVGVDEVNQELGTNITINDLHNNPYARHKFYWKPDFTEHGQSNDAYYFDWNFDSWDYWDPYGAHSQDTGPWSLNVATKNVYNNRAGYQNAPESYREFPNIRALKYAYQSDWNCALVQVPDDRTLLGAFLEWVREQDEFYEVPDVDIFNRQFIVEQLLGPDPNSLPHYDWESFENFKNFTGQQEWPWMYLFSEITSANMVRMPFYNSGGSDAGSPGPKNIRWVAITDDNNNITGLKWANPNTGYSNNLETDEQVSSAIEKWFPEYPIFPMIADAEPYGDQVWYWAYEWDWVDAGEVTKYTNSSGNLIVPNSNGLKIPIPKKWVVFNFLGEFNVNRNAPKNLNFSELYDDNVTHVFSITQFHDFGKYAVLSAHERKSSSVDKTRQLNHTANFTHNYFWNGQNQDVSDEGEEVGPRSGTQHGTGSAQYFGQSETMWAGVSNFEGHGFTSGTQSLNEGGYKRYHFLHTKANGLGQIAGCLEPSTMIKYSGSWGIDEVYRPAEVNHGVLSYGIMPNYQSEEWAVLALGKPGSAENEFNHAVVGLKLIMPTIGSLNSMRDSFNVSFKYKFNLMIDQDTLLAQDGLEDGIMDKMKIRINANCLESSFDGRWHRGGYSKTRDLDLTYNELLDLCDDEGNIMINNIDPEETGLSLNLGEYGEGESLEGISADLFWTGQWPRGKGKPWKEGPNQFKDINLRMEVKPPSYGDVVVNTVLPINLQLYDLHLHMDGCFDSFDASDFYIENYLGRCDYSGAIYEKDSEVLTHFLRNELSYNGDISVENSTGAVQHNLGFSVTEEIKGRTLIENICSNTRIIPTVKGVDGLVLSYIKDSYSVADRTIKADDVIKIKFDLSKIEKVKSMVEVKFAYNYGTEGHDMSTGLLSAKDLYGDGDLGYEDGYKLKEYSLGEEYNLAGESLVSEEIITRVFHSNYITKLEDALKLQEFLVMFNCNQKLLFEADLPLTYLTLQAGDICDFDRLVSDKKAFGKDYTKTEKYNGQTLQPFFMITEVKKTNKKISIKGCRLPELSRTFNASLGDIARRGKNLNIGMENPDNAGQKLPTFLDEAMIYDYVADKTKRYTREQIQNMDINRSNGITYKDASLLAEYVEIGENWYMGGPVDAE